MKAQSIADVDFKPCEKCSKWFSLKFGIPKEEFRNGNTDKIKWELAVGKMIMDRSGMEVKQVLSTQEVVQEFDKFWTKREQEKNAVENLLKKKELETQKTTRDENRDELEAKEKEIKKMNEQKQNDDKLITHLQTELSRLSDELKLSPVKKGDKLEQDVATVLNLAFKEDEIQIEKHGQKEIDLRQTVIEGKKSFGKLFIECKERDSWNDAWINETKTHMRKENAEYGIVVTRTMPTNIVILSPLGVEKDGVFITEPANVKYVVAFYRLAMIRTANAMAQIKTEQERSNKATEISKKIGRMFETADFTRTFELITDLRKANNNIKKAIKSANTKILEAAESVETIVDDMFKINSALEDAFKDVTKS